ncbi:hypothetical protein PMIN01_02143 [Paraphaeosphaeria minitans]|uniref:Uncharacterized protein n=1 Tax=Paraphaeosphaeria minitans TaxID=565426 RepID=A0A9P6KV52_9PLEO|nr:hypothetical protein PMIN01_02143 [Paraphaeosphaeria minitans]
MTDDNNDNDCDNTALPTRCTAAIRGDAEALERDVGCRTPRFPLPITRNATCLLCPHKMSRSQLLPTLSTQDVQVQLLPSVPSPLSTPPISAFLVSQPGMAGDVSEVPCHDAVLCISGLSLCGRPSAKLASVLHDALFPSKFASPSSCFSLRMLTTTSPERIVLGNSLASLPR